MDVGALLLQVKNGQITIDEAERLLKDLPYEELGYAKLIITGSCVPALGKQYFVRASQMLIWRKFFGSCGNGTERYWEPGQHQSSMSWFIGSFQRWFMIRFPEF